MAAAAAAETQLLFHRICQGAFVPAVVAAAEEGSSISSAFVGANAELIAADSD